MVRVGYLMNHVTYPDPWFSIKESICTFWRYRLKKIMDPNLGPRFRIIIDRMEIFQFVEEIQSQKSKCFSVIINRWIKYYKPSNYFIIRYSSRILSRPLFIYNYGEFFHYRYLLGFLIILIERSPSLIFSPSVYLI